MRTVTVCNTSQWMTIIHQGKKAETWGSDPGAGAGGWWRYNQEDLWLQPLQSVLALAYRQLAVVCSYKQNCISKFCFYPLQSVTKNLGSYSPLCTYKILLLSLRWNCPSKLKTWPHDNMKDFRNTMMLVTRVIWIWILSRFYHSLAWFSGWRKVPDCLLSCLRAVVLDFKRKMSRFNFGDIRPETTSLFRKLLHN